MSKPLRLKSDNSFSIIHKEPGIFQLDSVTDSNLQPSTQI